MEDSVRWAAAGLHLVVGQVAERVVVVEMAVAVVVGCPHCPLAVAMVVRLDLVVFLDPDSDLALALDLVRVRVLPQDPNCETYSPSE